MSKEKINFWCRNGLHFWRDYMPMCFKQGCFTYDTDNDWRKCKKCNKTQMRTDEYSSWKNK
ncbi:hypothetical protein ACFSKN_14975 [Mariniflexile gromovii]|uniref:Uncharacterized protein n=1 Tax=Mariniflexile gromovii TaxID=362523 RepID=A0ABS4BZ69_9FLAO|nr:hypothetical protein [Mariniflexile gromovii]MBP0905882.1 hypothetical protein [Mariniflexile gromovii]